MNKIYKSLFLILFLFFGFYAKSAFAANRCWIGGGSSANWNATGNTNWGDCAGATNQSVPGSGDDVFFNASSGSATSTISANISIKSLDMTGGTAPISQSAAVTLTVAGGASATTFTLAANKYAVVNVTTSIIQFTATTGTTTITSAANSLGNITINTPGGAVVLADGLTINSGSTLTYTAGTFLTDGPNNNSALTHSWGLFSSNNSNTRVLNLGASSINITTPSTGAAAWAFGNSTTGLTVNAGTSLVTFTGPNVTFSEGAKTFYDVVFQQGGAIATAALGTTTLHNLTVTLTNGTFTQNFVFQSDSYNVTNLTINGGAITTGTVTAPAGKIITASSTMAIAGNTATNRLLIQSSTLGTATTFNAGTVTVSNVDFRDVTGAGAGSWNLSAIAGKSGDCGGNSGITFTSAVSQTLTGSSQPSMTWSTYSWPTRVPLPQDDVIVNLAFTSGRTITLDMPRAGHTLDFSGVTWSGTAVSFTANVGLTVYGSLKMPTAGTPTGSLFNPQTMVFEGRSGTLANGTSTAMPASGWVITCSGGTYGSTVTFQAFGGIYQFGDNFNANGNQVFLNNGTIDANGYNYSGYSFTSNGSATRAIIMGSGTWNIVGIGSQAWLANSSLSVTPNSSTIKFTDTSTSGATFGGGGLTYNNIWFARGASTATTTISGSNTFNEFKDTGTGTHGMVFTAGTTQTIAKWSVSGTATNTIILDSSTTAVFNLIKTGTGIVSADYLNIKHSSTSPSTLTWYAGANSVNNQAVVTAGSGWIFSNAPVRYWVGGTATWDGTVGTKWALNSGTAGGYPVPTTVDNVYFDASSTAATITLSASSTARSIDATGFTGTISHPAGVTLTIGDGTAPVNNNGFIFPSSGATYTFGDPATSIISYVSTSTTATNLNFGNITGGAISLGGGQTLNNVTLSNNAVTINGNVTINGTFTNASGVAVTTSGVLTNNGTFTAGAGTYNFTGSGTPFINTGTFTPGTSTIRLQSASGTTTIPSLSYYNLDVSPASGTSTFQFNGSGWYSSSWLYRKPITINHNFIASSTSEAYTNFPVLVSLSSDANLAANASSTGADILFTSSNGTTKLPHQIETYASSTGALISWVNVPSLSTSTDTTLYMYYGNAAAASQQAATSTWNSGYKGVWHLPNGTVLAATDSTGNLNGTVNGSVSAVAGKIDGGASFPGTSANYISVGAITKPSSFTINTWVNFQTYTQNGFSGIVWAGDGASAWGIAVQTSTMYARVSNASTAQGVNIDTLNSSNYPAGWHYLTLTVDGSNIRYYKDGSIVGSPTVQTVPNTGASDTLSIGRWGSYTGSDSYFNGYIDDARVSNTVRSADWIKTEYNNQSATSTFYTVGSQDANGIISNNFTSSGAGTATIDAYTYNPPVTVNGNITIGTNTTFLAPSSSAFTLLGNFTNNGTFTHENGTVTFAPTATSTIAGTSVTTFYNFTSTSTGKTIKFKAGQATGFAGALTLTGTNASPINIQSDTTGSQWQLNLTGTYNINYIWVKDSGCYAGSLTIAGSSKIINGGNNGGCWSMSLIAGGGGGGSVITVIRIDGTDGGGTQTSGGGSGGAGSGSSGGTTQTGDTGAGTGGGGTQSSGGSSGGGGGAAP